jgi:hypothetical protein
MVRLPVVSGAKAVKAFLRAGWRVAAGLSVEEFTALL